MPSIEPSSVRPRTSKMESRMYGIIAVRPFGIGRQISRCKSNLINSIYKTKRRLTCKPNGLHRRENGREELIRMEKWWDLKKRFSGFRNKRLLIRALSLSLLLHWEKQERERESWKSWKREARVAKLPVDKRIVTIYCWHRWAVVRRCHTTWPNHLCAESTHSGFNTHGWRIECIKADLQVASGLPKKSMKFTHKCSKLCVSSVWRFGRTVRTSIEGN